jgi:hypothetical protein
MDPHEVARLRDDLTTLRRSAGLEPAFERAEITCNVALGIAGLLAAAWGLLATGLPSYLGLLPMLLVALFWSSRYHDLPSPASRRGWAAVALLLADVGGFALWSRQQQIPGLYLRATGALLIGLACSTWGVLDLRRRYLLAYGLPMVVAGLFMPWLTVSWVMAFGAASALGFSAMALWQWRQLRAVESGHVAN